MGVHIQYYLYFIKIVIRWLSSAFLAVPVCQIVNFSPAGGCVSWCYWRRDFHHQANWLEHPSALPSLNPVEVFIPSTVSKNEVLQKLLIYFYRSLRFLPSCRLPTEKNILGLPRSGHHVRDKTATVPRVVQAFNSDMLSASEPVMKVSILNIFMKTNVKMCLCLQRTDIKHSCTSLEDRKHICHSRLMCSTDLLLNCCSQI